MNLLSTSQDYAARAKALDPGPLVGKHSLSYFCILNAGDKHLEIDII